MDEIVTKPSADDIRRADAEFDSENGILEGALQELFGQYPHNTQPAQVLLKVTALNTFYSTQIPLYRESIPTIFDVAEHIVALGIDSDLERGNDGLVSRLAKTEVPRKKVYFYYSFATKYCSWHNPNAYPIFDSRVYAYLCHLVNHDCLDRFRQNDLWDYPNFKKVIQNFQERNQLGDFTFKDIDKFLYLQGTRVIGSKKKKETEPIGTEALLVPVPGQPGEMEWSIENYPTPQEAENSRKKFTDSAGWTPHRLCHPSQSLTSEAPAGAHGTVAARHVGTPSVDPTARLPAIRPDQKPVRETEDAHFHPGVGVRKRASGHWEVLVVQDLHRRIDSIR